MGQRKQENYKVLRLFSFIIAILIFHGCTNQDKEQKGFLFSLEDQGIALSENGKQVLFYQQEAVMVLTDSVTNAVNPFNHYIHPLYNLDEEVITEAQVVESDWHPHQRGIFWAWHQLYIDSTDLGDSWTMDYISYDIKNAEAEIKNNIAILNSTVHWHSSKSGHDLAFVEENLKMKVYPEENRQRIIDFEISLKGLVPGVKIGGSKDKKEYGGFSARIDLSDSMNFLTNSGLVEPITGQLKAGSWVDFSSTDKYALAILCHPETPNYPSPWLLRRTGSMQNPAFPGKGLYPLSMTEETKLFYRIIIHDGNARIEDLEKSQATYSNTRDSFQ